jgi:hypothetical protein
MNKELIKSVIFDIEMCENRELSKSEKKLIEAAVNSTIDSIIHNIRK